jgi:cation diffusion facilitator family transporter
MVETRNKGNEPTPDPSPARLPGAAASPVASPPPPRTPSPPPPIVSPDARDMSRRKTGVAVLSVVSNAFLIILKIAVGLLIGSVGILSEAIHSAVDLVASFIALFGVRKASEAADQRHPYGHGKFENIAGTIEAVLIFAAAIWIIYEAVGRLINPQPLDMPGWGVAVMFVSVLVNLLVARRLFKVGRATESVALQADAWHHRTDVYTSLGVMLGLLVIWIGGLIWPSANLAWIDPVVAIIVALMIVKAAYDLTKEAALDLVDVSLPDKDVEWIPGFVKEGWPAVRSFHHLQTRKAGSTRFIDFHLAVDDSMSVGEAHALGDEIVAAIKERLRDSRVHIHVEPCAHHCPESCESGCLIPSEARRWEPEAR